MHLIVCEFFTGMGALPGRRDKHLAFCQHRGIQSWAEVDKQPTKQYGKELADRDYADRSICLELTLGKSVLS